MELWLIKAVQSIHSPWLDFFMQLCSTLVEQTVLLAVIVVIYWCIDKRAGRVIIVSLLASVCLNTGLKNIFQSPRPYLLYPDEIRVLRAKTAGGYSFPSGHTQAISTFAAAACLEFRKKWMYSAGGVFIILVAVSRVYLGVHFPRDVIFGAFIGILCAAVCVFLMNCVLKRHAGLLLSLAALGLAAFLSVCFSGKVEIGYFKMFGAFCGLALGIFLEERLVQFHTNIPLIKKILRCLTGFVFLGLCAEAVGRLCPWNTALFSALRMGIVVFCAIFVYPFLFVKMDL